MTGAEVGRPADRMAGPALVVAMVTYGQRAEIVRETMRRLAEIDLIEEIVVVDNASSPPTQQLVDALPAEARQSLPITVIRSEQNRGSAFGFAAALAHLRDRPPTTRVLLLDDDNVPDADGVPAALDLLDRLSSDDAVLMHRESRPEITAAVANRTHIRSVLNSYGTLSLRAKFHRAPSREPGEAQLLTAEYAPYGGLLFELALVSRIGLPDERFFVYADDHEYTSRIVRAGGKIVLCETAGLRDLELSWHSGRSRTAIAAFDPAVPDLRAFYSIRNRLHLERTELRTSRLEWAVNGLAFWTLCLLDLLKVGVLDRAPGPSVRRLKLLVRAARDGHAGRLGRIEFS